MSILIDGFDLADIGFVVDDELTGWRDGPDVDHPVANMPGRFGVQRLTRRGQRRPRRLLIVGTMVAQDLATLQANTRELRRRVYAKLDDEVEVRFGDDTTKYYTAVVESCQIPPIPPALTQRAHQVRITLLCPDPLAYDEDLTTADFSAGPADLELGDAPSWPEITVNGPLAGPWQLIYRNAAGEIVSSLTMSGEIASGSGIMIDMRTQLITDLGGEQLTPSGEPLADQLIEGDFFRYRPEDADWTQDPPAWPTIEASPTPSGGATSVHRKAWLGI